MFKDLRKRTGESPRLFVNSDVVRRRALIYLAMASTAIVLSSRFSGFFVDLSMVILVMGFPTALICLAVTKNGKLGPLKVPLAVLTVVLESCGIAMFLLRGRVALEPFFGGFPVAAAFQLYGLWLGPLLLVGLAYGLTFEHWELRDSDLRRFEDRRCGSGEDAEK